MIAKEFQMKSLRRIALIGLAAVPVPAEANDTTLVTVMGYGTRSCGSMISSVDGFAPGKGTSMLGWPDNRQYFSESSLYAQWIQGFITAANAVNGAYSFNKPQIAVDFAGIDQWFRHWCASHPVDNLATASEVFVKEQWDK